MLINKTIEKRISKISTIFAELAYMMNFTSDNTITIETNKTKKIIFSITGNYYTMFLQNGDILTLNRLRGLNEKGFNTSSIAYKEKSPHITTSIELDRKKEGILLADKEGLVFIHSASEKRYKQKLNYIFKNLEIETHKVLKDFQNFYSKLIEGKVQVTNDLSSETYLTKLRDKIKLLNLYKIKTIMKRATYKKKSMIGSEDTPSFVIIKNKDKTKKVEGVTSINLKLKPISSIANNNYKEEMDIKILTTPEVMTLKTNLNGEDKTYTIYQEEYLKIITKNLTASLEPTDKVNKIYKLGTKRNSYQALRDLEIITDQISLVYDAIKSLN